VRVSHPAPTQPRPAVLADPHAGDPPVPAAGADHLEGVHRCERVRKLDSQRESLVERQWGASFVEDALEAVLRRHAQRRLAGVDLGDQVRRAGRQVDRGNRPEPREVVSVHRGEAGLAAQLHMRDHVGGRHALHDEDERDGRAVDHRRDQLPERLGHGDDLGRVAGVAQVGELTVELGHGAPSASDIGDVPQPTRDRWPMFPPSRKGRNGCSAAVDTAVVSPSRRSGRIDA